MNTDNAYDRKKILIYSAGMTVTASRFEKEVEQMIPDTVKNVYRTLEAFKQTLVRHMGKYQAIVLLCTTHEELYYFLLIRDLISENRLVLIVPDHQAETINRAHRLYPRFLSFADSNFKDVAAVIRKMANIEFNTRS